MSAVRTRDPADGLAGLRMTASEFLALGETPERYELVNGVVVKSPSPRPRHSKVIQEVLRQLDQYTSTGGLADIYTETDLRIDDLDVLCPDICVYARPLPAPLPERLLDAPDSVVEVLSPGTEGFDLITKRDDYEQRGVGEYWVIDPKDGRGRAWRRRGERFEEAPVGEGTIQSTSLPGFSLQLASVRRAAGTMRP